jgi:hypothetical protein
LVAKAGAQMNVMIIDIWRSRPILTRMNFMRCYPMAVVSGLR